jgi:hypothetical protein
VPNFPFLVSQGAIAQCIRQHDLGAMPLGDVMSWPVCSKNSGGDVGTVMGSSSLGSETIKRTYQMAKLIFINLPVSDLARATAFYQAIGAGIMHGIFRYHPRDADDIRKVSVMSSSTRAWC